MMAEFVAPNVFIGLMSLAIYFHLSCLLPAQSRSCNFQSWSLKHSICRRSQHWICVQHLLAELPQGAAHVGKDRFGSTHLLKQAGHSVDGGSFESFLEGAKLIDDATQGPDIRWPLFWPPTESLWASIVWQLVFPRSYAGAFEVAKLQKTHFQQDKALWRKVSMKDVFLVYVFQGSGRLSQAVDGEFGCDCSSFSLGQPYLISKIPSIEMLCAHTEPSRVQEYVAVGDDVWMPQFGEPCSIP
mmetsp:Transcript_10845/g.19283  ORF Transcript_10845/g.19283 Transcript_10845/m.19283 type:complete len:242 (+) Transcript_10845:2130-2855(+)